MGSVLGAGNVLPLFHHLSQQCRAVVLPVGPAPPSPAAGPPGRPTL